jgi:hypothetical protein
MTNIPPSSYRIEDWRKRRDNRRAERLAKEAAVAERAAGAAKVRQDRRDYAKDKAAGFIPNPTAHKSIEDSGGYDLNGNPL